MLAFLYQKEKLEIKTWMSLDDSMVDDNVNFQLLLNCKDPATDFAVSRSPLLCDTTDLMIFDTDFNFVDFHSDPLYCPLHLCQMGAARLDNKCQFTKG